ncbi:MAG TPA: hypothetical protein PLC88_02045 [Syntrophomonas sp.]|nr:hypothetical protein [Syntrophomonas sp.]HRW11826.1 hypothetical protein [Syntrophomonas sp.]
MTEMNTPQAPAPDPEAMKALMAKIAKIQKILKFLYLGQATVAVLLLLLAFMPNLSGSPHVSFAFLMLVPFFCGLAYLASFAGKDLTFAKAAFRNTAISQLGLFIVALYVYVSLGAPMVAVLAVLALIFGALAGMVIYQASKG